MLKPITELIKQHEVSLSTRKLNDRLLAMGLLEERTRPSSTDPAKMKKYKALTDAGLVFGQNIGNDYSDETQPKYYEDSFVKLLEHIGHVDSTDKR